MSTNDTRPLHAPSLDELADILASAEDTESLVRPLLALLQAATGMESAYFTSIDHRAGIQYVDFAHNIEGGLVINEGVNVPWYDTLCKRAIQEERFFTNDVPERWGDSKAARELGIVSYLSTPVRVGDGDLHGTLCAASASRIELPDGAERLLGLFAKLVARQIEHERLLAMLRRENQALSEVALVDPLTGLPNRRALLDVLDRRMASCRHADVPVLVAFVDLDGFKGINDTHGHDAGDRFLVEVARRLKSGLREGDVVGRLGGDEFLVVTAGSHLGIDSAREALRLRIEDLVEGDYDLGSARLHYPGASVGVVACSSGTADRDALLAEADAAMYARKRERRALRGAGPG
ncbi:MAG: GGDEF domain-containing protein [Lysobacteraceae bacterium]